MVSIRLAISFIIRRAFGIKKIVMKLHYVRQVEPFVASIKFTVLRDFKPINSSFWVFLFISLFLLSLIFSLLDFSSFRSSHLFHIFISPVFVLSLKILPNQLHDRTQLRRWCVRSAAQHSPCSSGSWGWFTVLTDIKPAIPWTQWRHSIASHTISLPWILISTYQPSL